MNVQLLRTTPYLSGQQKLDICLKTVNSRLVTGDCNFTPLSSAIPYTDSSYKPFFKYSYQENLKWLKNEIQRDFYSDIPEIRKGEMLYEDSDIEFVDPVDHSYCCGMRRQRFQKYKKQFSWLCPLWIEDASLIDRLTFVLTLKGDNQNNITAKRTIYLSTDLKDSLYNYLSNPMVSSKLLTINYNKETAFIYGLNPSTGATCEVDVSYIVPQLLERERPIMETNSLLNQLFASNDLIARQLINFNFCFNPEDLIAAHELESAYYKRWKITIEAYDGTTKIPLKDIFTNYDEIPSYMISGDQGSIEHSINVFNYLEDNNYIEYANVNKTTQPDVYWSLTENPSYIYNLYNGFSSWYLKNGQQNERFQTQGLMYTQPDCAHSEYESRYNNIGWCKVYDFPIYTLEQANARADEMITTEGREKVLTTFKKNQDSNIVWANGLKYNCSQNIPTIYVGIFLYNGNTNNGVIGTQYGSDPYTIKLFLPRTNSDAKTLLTVKTLVDDSVPSINPIAPNAAIPDTSILFDIIKNLVYPEKLIFNKSILPIREDSPSITSNEISYIKREYNVNTFVYRYSGDLRPYFVDPEDSNFYNVLWRYKKYKKSDFTAATSEAIEYSQNIKKGWSPVFKSIGFYPLERESSILGRIPYFSYPSFYSNDMEFSWYMDSRFFFLPMGVENIEFTSSTNNALSDDDILREMWTQTIGPNRLSLNSWNKQIKNYYTYNIKYDYLNDTNINILKFDCKYTLR